MATKTAKKPVKKTAEKAEKAKKKSAKTSPKAESKRGDSIRLQIFKMLRQRDDGYTGQQIQEKLELSGIPSLLKDEGCAANPRIKRHKNEETRGVHYVLSAAGKKALEGKTVDSGKPEKAAGKEWPTGR